MELTNTTFAPLRVMIDELARCGVRHAVVSPGSRNAPITCALADHDDITCWSVLDERSAGFFAVGLAKSTNEAVAITCSSGTAAANLHPAVIEADHAGVPLIVLTADRPPELRDVGAGQAIDQIKLFGSSVRWFVEAGNHPLNEQTLRHFRGLGCRATAEATGPNPGPVHVNLPLREPLHAVQEDLAELETTPAAIGRPGRGPWTSFTRTARSVDECDVLERIRAAERPLIVIGEQRQPGLADAIADFSAASGVPILADALSQMRRHSIADRATVVCAYDLILRNAAAREHLAPDFILRLGELPTSKPLRDWLSGLDCPQTVIDPRGVWHEATRVATDLLQMDPLALFAGFDQRYGGSASSIWSDTWRNLEKAAQSAIDTALTTETFPFEPAVYRSLLNGLDGGATVYVSSSMPVRDVETFVLPTRDDVRFLSNRGANGIDGVLSSALGAKAPWGCDRVILLTGDLALLYDISALATARRLDIPITIVCVDNNGGGIFSFLPLAENQSHFEELIATPHDLELEALCRAFGLSYSRPDSAEALASAASGFGLIHLPTERRENLEAHRRVADAVSSAISDSISGLTAIN